MNKQSFFSFRNTKVQALLLFLGSLLFLYLMFYSTLEQTARPEFCSLCHAMKPEYYTLKASSHENVNCVACHRLTTTVDKLGAIKRFFYTVTGTYMAPIKMTGIIPDENCEQCHNLPKRTVTPSEDLIIPHSVHKNKKINCSKCHRGVAHGHIADRQVTYKSDYGKWDSTLAKALMTPDQTRPVMETCMRCHEVRKGPLECRACHRTSMLPETHRHQDFGKDRHGLMAAQDLKSCDQCHGYMSKEKFQGFQEVPAYKRFLAGNQEQSQNQLSSNNGQVNYRDAQAYAKVNTFCRKCHEKRPPSHTPNFTDEHGQAAKNNQQRCLTCHDNRVNNQSVTKVSCGKCHPAVHAKNFQWKLSHPIPLAPDQKVVEKCYDCHLEKRCGVCHTAKSSQTKGTNQKEGN